MKYRTFFSFLPPFVIIVSATSMFWGPILVPYVFVGVILLFLAYFLYTQLTIGWRFFRVYWNMRRTPKDEMLLNAEVKHLIVVPNYKENYSTIQKTLNQLASHRNAQTSYIICLAQEEAETGCEEKAGRAIEEYKDQFWKMYFTVHPFGRPNEVRGKGSNVCWAVREMKKKIIDEEKLCSIGEVIVTLPDADSYISQAYFDYVDQFMGKQMDNQNREFMFTPIVSWVQNSLQVPIFVRMADAIYCMLYNQNLLGLFGIQFPYSTYGIPLQLADEVGYWDVGADAIGDELHMWLKCYFLTRGRLRSVQIWAPILVSNVEVDSYWGTIKAKWNQSYRWAQGVHDMSYTICKFIELRSQLPTFKTIALVLRMFETLLITPLIVFFILGIGLWKFLPFWYVPQFKEWAFYLQIVSNVGGALGVFWFIAYQLFHNHIADRYSPHDRRPLWRAVEYILATPSLAVLFGLPFIWVGLTKFSLSSAEKFVYVTAPKPTSWGNEKTTNQIV